MTKKIIEARVLRNKKIGDMVYQMTLQCPDGAMDAEPGQFVNVYLQDKSLLLPRPISICFTEEDRLTLVYKVIGKGTLALSSYGQGDTLRISTALGQGYRLDSIFQALDKKPSGRERVIALVGGGLGVPPMIGLAQSIRGHLEINKGIQLIAILGFAEEPFLMDELNSLCDQVFLATENGNSGFRGNVLQMMELEEIIADYYLACGPKPMLKALASFCEKQDAPIQVSLEERMGCGYGACVGCTCKTKETEAGEIKVTQKKVCKDGPVFFGNEVVWDE